MSIKWRYKNNDASYRVVEAGKSVRLYRNNVLHSQWNPNNPVSGKLWDLFLVSALGLNMKVSDVLVLGAGGGSIINLIHHYFPQANIQAIDIDRIHLKVAKKYFKINVRKCKLIHADAEEWLKTNNGKKYDLIIDDVFGELNNIPYRSLDGNKNWVKYILRNLKSGGIVVFNFADNDEWKKNFKIWKSSIDKKNIAVSTHRHCENKIVHLSKENISYKNVKSQLNNINEYAKHFNNGMITYRTVKIH